MGTGTHMQATVHATSVVLEDHAILIRGESGSGKSDLALRLMDRGARLLADDQTCVVADGLSLLALPPETIAGLMEVRGLGVVQVRNAATAAERFPVALIVDLVVRPEHIERLPDQAACHICDVVVPGIHVYGFAASAPAVVSMALDAALGRCAVVSSE